MGVPQGQVHNLGTHWNLLPPVDDAQAGSSAAGPAGKNKDKDKMLPSFWIPSLTPEAKATKLEKPVSTPCQQAPFAHFASISRAPSLGPSPPPHLARPCLSFSSRAP